MKNEAAKVPSSLSPAQYLKSAFQEWGVPVVSSRDQPDFLPVTPERTQAYDRELLGMVRRQDLKALQSMLDQNKLSNACNTFGESLLHLACRKGLTSVVEFLVGTANLSCLVHDDYGRTIWHDACWTVRPEWTLIGFLLERAPQLLTMSDVRGHIPVDYVPKTDWGVWVDFLERHRDRLKALLLLAKEETDGFQGEQQSTKDGNVASNSPTSLAARATIEALESMHRMKGSQDFGVRSSSSSSSSTGTLNTINEDEHDGERRMSITQSSASDALVSVAASQMEDSQETDVSMVTPEQD
jgi:hypothetical protein